MKISNGSVEVHHYLVVFNIWKAAQIKEVEVRIELG